MYIRKKNVCPVIKVSIWLTETMKFSSETERLKRMQHGPYIVWDEEEDLDD